MMISVFVLLALKATSWLSYINSSPLVRVRLGKASRGKSPLIILSAGIIFNLIVTYYPSSMHGNGTSRLWTL